MGLEMLDNSELEEGEACYFKDDDENINPDTDLSYIDEKIQSVLGHFKKDFEGGIFAENLGAKYGGYGSFLPTYEHSPSVSSHPQTPQKIQQISMEVAPQNLRVSKSAALPARLEIVPSTHQPFNHSRIPPVNVLVKKDSHFSTAQIAQKCSSKDETFNRTRTLTDHRPLKVRIKMSSGNIAQKNAIYSGLGLDDSPSSSLGESPEESKGVASRSQVTINESLTNILQVMTSFPVPENILISPLHDSLLCLIKEEKHHESILEHSPNGVEEDNGSVSQREGKKLLKESRRKLAGKSKKQRESKYKSGSLFENDLAIAEKRTLEKENPKVKECMSNGLKCMPLSNSLLYANRASEVSQNSINNEVKGGSSSPELEKEEPLESIFGPDKNKKQNSRSRLLEKDLDKRVKDLPKNLPSNFRDDGRCNGNKISAILDTHCDVSKGEKDLDPCTQNIGQNNIFHEEVEKIVSHKKEKSSSGGKNKSKPVLGNGKTAAASTGGLRVGMDEVVKDQKNTIYGAGPCITKREKLKSHKKNIVRDSNTEVVWSKDYEQASDVLDLRKRLPGERSKDVRIGKVEVQRKPLLEKPKETPSSYDQLMSELSVKDAPNAYLPTVENKIGSQIVQSEAAPVLIEDWVQCDICRKWRLLPLGIKPESLPQLWLCSMLNWLPGMSRCDISQEETTNALYALYQPPLPDSQNNLHYQAKGSSRLTSVDPGHFDKNYQKHNSNDDSNRVTKKYGLKKLSNVGSSSIPTESSLHEPTNNRSLNDINKPPIENKLVKKSKPHYMSQPDNLVTGKKMSKQSEKHVNGGDAKEMKNRKRGTDQSAGGVSKKPKIEVMYDAIKHRNSDVDVGKVAPRSNTGKPTKVCVKDSCLSKETKIDGNGMLQISLQRVEHQSRVSSGGGSFDVKMSNGADASMKKRKLKDWQDSQSHVKTLQNALYDGKVDTEESSESGFKKEKIMISKPEQELSAKGDNNRSNRKGRVVQNILSSNKSNQVDGREKDGNSYREDQSRKPSKRMEFQQTIDSPCSLRKDLGSRHFSMAANSSSSKVSNSPKIMGNFEEMKGSPVESVSSSPLRTSNLAKSTGNDALGKDVLIGGFPSLTKGDINQFGAKRKEKVLSDLRSGSHKFSNLDHQDGDAYRFSIKNESSFQLHDSHLVSGNHSVAGHHPSGLHDKENCYGKDRTINNNCTVRHKLSKGSSLLSEDVDRSFTFDLDRFRKKVADSLSGYSKKSQKCNSDPERFLDVKHGSAKRCSTMSVKDEENHTVPIDLTGQRSGDSVMKAKEEENMHGWGVNLGSKYRSNGEFTPQLNLIQNSENIPAEFESSSEKSKLISHSKNEDKRGRVSLGCQPVPGSEKAGTLRGFSSDGSVGAGIISKVLGSADSKSRFGQNIERVSPDHKGARRSNASSLSRNSADLAAVNALKEAKHLRDHADHAKSSEFAFERNDGYFQAALKFLHVAVLLEACSSEIVKHVEMNQMQAYITAAKRCEICAHEYEERQEMASAALAYKCMEVAYMRVVYCKQSTTVRDRHELQASLNMAPQGESPSSSASDIDNLNIQVMMERATLSKGGATHIAGNHVLVAENRPNFVRLLDFVQDVNLAMEASRKSQITFTAASTTLTASTNLSEAQKSKCVALIKRVIDFSFQDNEEFIGLVQDAMKTISPFRFDGARD